MSLPALSNWDSTRIGLHQAAQVMGAVRRVVVKPLPNWAHLGLFVAHNGVTTGKMPEGDELILDFATQVITYICPAQTVNPIPLAGHTQMTLMDAVVKTMTDTGHGVEPERGKITGTEKFDINPALAAEYTTALYSMYTTIAR